MTPILRKKSKKILLNKEHNYYERKHNFRDYELRNFKYLYKLLKFKEFIFVF